MFGGLIGALVGIAVFALAAVYAERKVAAFIQDRLGPMEVGPFGLLQTVADIIKLLLKETIIPASADKFIFIAAPIIIFAAVFAGFSIIPFGPQLVSSNTQVGVLFLLAVVSLDVIGLLMTGWGSNNKYALLGAIRSVSQIIAYEVPAGLSLLAGLITLGTLQLDQMAMNQSIFSHEKIYFLGLWDIKPIGGLLAWNVIRYPHLIFVFVIFFISSLAEANRAPFDLPEAESELVGGFHTEYTGFGFAVMFLAEYANMLLLSLLAVFVFLGGWSSPLPNLFPIENTGHSIFELIKKGQLASLTSGKIGEFSGYFWGFFWTLSKAFILIFAQMWIRWTYPRFRPDQLMRLCWKYLTPITIIAIFISAFWKYFETVFAY